MLNQADVLSRTHPLPRGGTDVIGPIQSGLRSLAAVLLAVLSCLQFVSLTLASSSHSFQSQPSKYSLTRQDEIFLDELERRSFNYFWTQADPRTGLVPDRARMDGSPLDEEHQNVGSIAATGFGLTALCIASDRGWITPQQARQRTRDTLAFFADEAFQERGWFYHWIDIKTGERRWTSEVSSIDTALLLAGVLTTRQCFRNDPAIAVAVSPKRVP